MSAHTPGPWCHLYRGEALGWVVDQADVQHIAAVCANETPDDDEANARLIAAAPDLLAALTAIVEHAEEVSERLECCWKLENAARAALAKARPINAPAPGESDEPAP